MPVRLEHLLDPAVERVADPGVEAGDVSKRLAPGHPAIEARLLAEVADRALVGLARCERHAGDRRAAAGRPAQAGEDLDRRGLAGAVRAEKAVDRPSATSSVRSSRARTPGKCLVRPVVVIADASPLLRLGAIWSGSTVRGWDAAEQPRQTPRAALVMPVRSSRSPGSPRPRQVGAASCDGEPSRDLDTRLEPELVEDARDVGLHGSLGDEQACGGLAIRRAIGNEAGHLHLPRRERSSGALAADRPRARAAGSRRSRRSRPAVSSEPAT